MSAAFAISQHEVGAFMNQGNELRPDLQKVVKTILALRRLRTNEGIFTHKTVRQILQALPPMDLASVTVALEECDPNQNGGFRGN